MAPEARRLEGKLDTVAELLQREAHAVDPLGQVHGSGFLNRRLEGRRAPRQASIDGPAPRRRARPLPIGEFQLRRDRLELTTDALEVGRDRPEPQTTPGFVARLLDGTADAPQRPVGQPTAFTQVIDQQGKNVEISHAAKAPGQLPKPTAELSHNGLFDLEDRDELAKAPRRDPDAVHRADLAGFDAR
jgi:hypothetical protein